MSVIKHSRVLNWKRDLPHPGDRHWKDYAPRKWVLPSRVDLREYFPPIQDQGQMGSCTGNALAAALGYLEMKGDPNFTYPATAGFDAVSRLFIYWKERVLEGDAYLDQGAMIRSGITALMQTGACTEKGWPYDEEHLFMRPTKEQFSEAWKHRLKDALRLDNRRLSQLRNCLAQGTPFVFGITVYSSFFSVKSDGLVPTPPLVYDEIMGGHALCAVGYDDIRKVFIVRNSWGSSWGENGYCYIPYEYLTSPYLAADFWAVIK